MLAVYRNLFAMGTNVECLQVETSVYEHQVVVIKAVDCQVAAGISVKARNCIRAIYNIDPSLTFRPWILDIITDGSISSSKVHLMSCLDRTIISNNTGGVMQYQQQ